MGIDARMFLRLRPQSAWLDEQAVLAAAVDLSATIGADSFLITDDDHALAVVEPCSTEDAEDYGGPELSGKTILFQDGPKIIAEPDEQFIRVNLLCRFYDEEYPRGDWLTIKAVAEWLERRFPAGEVWYGGDSSGVVAKPFGRDRRGELHEYFLARGRLDYWMNNSHGLQCPRCRISLSDVGGGRGRTFYRCQGCGRAYHGLGGELRRAPKRRTFPTWEDCKPLDEAEWFF